jgi:putative ABC transport system substrate-binding protein
MRRRDFITLLGGTGAAWPLATQAQQSVIPVIGFLHGASPDGNPERVRAFREGLKEAGFVEGENLAIEYRWADYRLDQLPAPADELVRRRVSVLVAPAGPPVAFAAKAATKTIPIVFLVAEDPVKLGLVASLNRPDGNLTGINFLNVELAAKGLGLLRDLLPGAVRIALLVDPASQMDTESTLRDVQTASRAMGLQLQVVKASTSREIDTVFESLVRSPPDALVTAVSAFFTDRRVQLALQAMLHRLPAIFPMREFVQAGGLMSYGASLRDALRQVGVYTGRILKGAKPADLPVVQSSKFELVINHQTARMPGPYRASDAACHRRRGDRVGCKFAAPHTSANGTSR